jgi:hypothetical protein
MTYDDPLITYDGTPTEAFFGQLLAKVEGVPAATLAAAQITPIHASDPDALTLQQFIALK